MGRRIQKSKRHKKVKAVDPFYTGERKKLLDKKGHLANARPQNVDEQEYPRKLREIMEAKRFAESNTRKKKRKKQTETDFYDFFGESEPGMVRPLKKIPVFKKAKKESLDHFLHRVNSQTHAVLEKTKMEEKFGVDVVEKPGGKVELKKKEKLSFDLPKKFAEKKQRTSEKAAKRREKEKLKKQQKLENKVDEFQALKDEVKFGEVVTAPPSLNFRPRKTSSISSKPGKRTLLLKQLLPSERNQSVIFPRSAITSTDRTVKRKLLSACDRWQLDEERKRVITAYRSSKKSERLKSSSNNIPDKS